MSSTHTSLDAAATERKARLAKLASLKRKQPHPDDNDPPTTTTETGIPSSPPDTTTDPTTSHLSNRNYDPTTRGPKLGFENPPLHPDQPTLETRAAALATTVAQTEAQESAKRAEGKGIDLFDLAPRKANWDLKRDLARKMEVLGQRTDNAIARVVRERVEREKGGKVNGKREGEGEEVGERLGMEGVDLVEGVHVREREEEEEERREREMERDAVEEEG